MLSLSFFNTASLFFFARSSILIVRFAFPSFLASKIAASIASISVYAGWYQHTLRINGKLCDEHNTLVNFTPIQLSTTTGDGIKIEAMISLTNRISIKANDKLI